MKVEYELTIKFTDEDDKKGIQLAGFGSGYRSSENATKMVRRAINKALTTYINTGKIVHDD